MLHDAARGRSPASLLASAVVSGLLCGATAQEPAAPPTPPAAAEGVVVDLPALLDAVCQPLVDAEVCSSLCIGVQDGDTRLVRGYGRVAPGSAAAPGAETLYEIGSVSKVFTGVLLADAVRRGAVALDDPVQKHLPETVVMPTFRGAPVRLWHLATHSSGLPRLPDMEGSDPSDPYAHFTFERLLEVLPAARVRWEPGSKYEYSNLAVGLLGAVLVRVAGASSFDALLAERVTGPLGMTDTMVVLDGPRAARLAAGHDADLSPQKPWQLAALAGAGGIRATVPDMLMFAAAQWAGDDAPLGTVLALARERRHDGSNGIAVGLGWHLARDGRTRWHNGQTGGYHSWFGVVTETRKAVCVLAGTATGAIDALGEHVLQRLHGLTVEPPKHERAVAVPREVLERYVGTYRMSPAITIAVTLGARGLCAQLTGQDALRIHARSATEFFYRVVDASITFEVEGDTVVRLVLHQNGRDMPARRVLPGDEAKDDGKDDGGR
jgi:D-alanyl-D-alanine-carboxypeptidase/D-alanyl-D-alanine-endopeptidase